MSYSQTGLQALARALDARVCAERNPRRHAIKVRVADERRIIPISCSPRRSAPAS